MDDHQFYTAQPTLRGTGEFHPPILTPEKLAEVVAWAKTLDEPGQTYLRMLLPIVEKHQAGH